MGSVLRSCLRFDFKHFLKKTRSNLSSPQLYFKEVRGDLLLFRVRFDVLEVAITFEGFPIILFFARGALVLALPLFPGNPVADFDKEDEADEEAHRELVVDILHRRAQ